MNVNIMMKSTSRTRNIQSIPYALPDSIQTLKELIIALVHIEIDKYENKEITVLNQESLDDMVQQGKVSFGFKYRETDIDREAACDTALLAQYDGLVVFFINNNEVDGLETKINLAENDEISIVRLTMMAGRMF